VTAPRGKRANQAVAARRAGAEVVFVAAAGNDDLGEQLLDHYEQERIDVSQVQVFGC
jgi:ribokinase